MIIQNVNNTVKDGKKNDYIVQAKLFVDDLKKVTGCMDAGVFDEEKDNTVQIISIWNNEEAMNSKEAGNVFLSHKAQLKPNFISNTTNVSKSI
ncbi:antibiotic biosynthesis monooxygenase [Lactobacillus amylovorus]|jgi:quinol monooxygenase YgiN|uniref:antibiotic biosynthesis monooxygenase n=1 Tax=Lactobacillus amylovorus TaxID=1604 RepID=UPI0022E672BF|nr:antibiotic biosynthesis monooxygenase [Lactobacillus amylovorus]